MFFQIKKLVLWPSSNHGPRVLEFATGQVNVISGLSKTGKSAVIPIIDYCLCSKKCSIPVGVIRRTCDWFGVVIDTAEGEKLFARREPGDQSQTGDMFVLEDNAIELPQRIAEKNATKEQVKTILNRLAGLSNLGMNPHSDGHSGKRTGFRDLMAFTFQPQNIVANPDVLFFKADTTENREKLIAIFPYVLNAITRQNLEDRWELDRLQRLLRIKESALKDIAKSVSNWISEANSWLQKAIELGLVEQDFVVPDEWPEILEVLRRIRETNYRAARPSLAAIEGVLSELEKLQRSETDEAMRLSTRRQRLMEIRRLIESSQVFGEALSIQRERLQISDWLRSRSSENAEPLTEVAEQGAAHLDALCSALAGVEIQIRSRETISDKMDKEQLRIRSEAEASLGRLTAIRSQIRELERRSSDVRSAIYRADQTERYLGRLEHAISLYERSGQDAELTAEVEDLKIRISDIRSRLSETQIQARIRRALAEIHTIAGRIIPTLDAEWPDAAIEIIIKDLTLKVIHDGRSDYLWEIGSGANWLAYHVAISLALQRFFQSKPSHPVPSFIVFDQPSQVYFPQTPSIKEEKTTEVHWDDEDIVAVRKIFQAVSNETVLADGKLQIILLDHADEQVWGDMPNTVLVENWREGDKLVPAEWIESLR